MIFLFEDFEYFEAKKEKIKFPWNGVFSLFDKGGSFLLRVIYWVIQEVI
jgi:hypothetical protein